MDILFEILLEIILEPIVTLLVGLPAEQVYKALHKEDGAKLSKRQVFVVALLTFLVLMVFLCAVLGIICGAILFAMGDTQEDKDAGLVILVAGLVLLVIFIVFTVVRVSLKKKRERKAKSAAAVRPDRSALRRLVHAVIDRPLGSVHPNHPDIVYGVNYGYVKDVMGGDGEEQDVYVLGVDEPISEFDGDVVAIIHRLDDVEDKWVVAPCGSDITDEEIIAKTEFQERFFKTEIIR